MHSYCIISAVGTRASRARARAPSEMDQPPAFKTRRSNAVQNRRLAMHVDLLERNMVVMETERARAVRQLQEELRQLRVPKMSPKLSPRQARIVAEIDAKFLIPKEKAKLPKLKYSSSKKCGVACQNMKVSVLASNNAALMPEDFVSLSEPQTCISVNESSSSTVINSNIVSQLQDHSDKQVNNNIVDGNGDDELVSKRGDSINSCSKPLPVTKSNTTKAIPGRKGAVHLRRTGSSQREDTGCIPLKTADNHRMSRSLSPSGYNQDTSEAVDVTSPNRQAERQRKKDRRTRRTEAWARTSPQTQDSGEVLNHHNEKGNTPTDRPEHRPPPESSQCPDRKLKNDGRSNHEVNPNTVSTPPKIQQSSTTPRLTGSSKRMSSKHRYRTRSTKSPKFQQLCPLLGTPHHRCELFPCVQPHTYHSLGFHPDLSSHPWRGWLFQNTCRPHHRLAPGRPLPPVGVDGRKTPADAPGYMKRKKLGKEEVIKLDMARKKEMNDLARPPSWNTNYGQPTPFKILKNPVRLSPLD